MMWKRPLFAKNLGAKKIDPAIGKPRSQGSIDSDSSLTEWSSEYCMIRFDASPDKVHMYTAATSLAEKEELFYSKTDLDAFQSERVDVVEDALLRKDAHIQSLQILLKNDQDQNAVEPYILVSIAQSPLRGYEYALSQSLQRQRQKTIECVLQLQETTQDADLLRSASRIGSSASRRLALKLAKGDAEVAMGHL